MGRLLLLSLGLVGLTLLAGCAPPPDSTGGEAVGLQSEPPTPAATPAPAETATGGGQVSWFYSLDEALDRARLLDRPILVDFYAEWCGPCKMMDQRTWPDAAVAQESARFICVRLDVDQAKDRAQEFGVKAVPTIAFVSPQGRILNRATGFMEPRELLRLMRRVR